MSKPMTDPVVEQYLRRLERAAAVLPADQRRELVDGIAGHISEARDSGAVTDEAALRTLLDRLGEPEEIVASAQDAERTDSEPWPHAPYPGAPVLRRPGIGRETAAVLFMTVGSIVPLLGWLVGVALLWTSSRWRTWEKVVATLVFPGGPFLVLWLGVLPVGGSQSCSGSSTVTSGGVVTETHDVCSSSGFSLPLTLGVPLFLAWFVLPIVIGITLLTRARRRADLEAWIPVPPTTPGAWTSVEVAAVALIGLGSVLAPFVGPVVGLIFVWMSPAWTRAEKMTATALSTGPLVVGLAFLVYIALAAAH